MKQQLRHTLAGIVIMAALAIGTASMLRLAGPYVRNSQDALWIVPNALGPLWWIIASVLGWTGALLMFLYLIMNQQWSGLLLSRILIAAGLVCFGMAPLNSGWIPWGVMISSIGGCYVSFLIATDWCHRENKWQDLWIALTGWMRRKEDGRARHRSIAG